MVDNGRNVKHGVGQVSLGQSVSRPGFLRAAAMIT